MKSKILLSSFIIFLILVLVSCKPIPTGQPEEARAEDAVYLYWRAITNRQYELAKWYCIPDGIWYNKVDEWEEYINTNSEGEVSLIISSLNLYDETEVIENNAIVYAEIFVDKIPFLGSGLVKVDIFRYETELVKIFPLGDWELK